MGRINIDLLKVLNIPSNVFVFQVSSEYLEEPEILEKFSVGETVRIAEKTQMAYNRRREYIICLGSDFVRNESLRVYSELDETNQAIEQLNIKPFNSVCFIDRTAFERRIPEIRIRVFSFVSAKTFSNDLEIAITPEAKEQYRNNNHGTDIITAFNDRYLFSSDIFEEEYRIALAETFSDTEFRFYSKTSFIDIRLPSQDKEFTFQREVTRRTSVPALTMFSGKISFFDLDLRQRMGIRKTYINEMRGADSYQSVWMAYEEQEKTQRNELKRVFGQISYKECEVLSKTNWRFYLENPEDTDKVRDLLSQYQSLEVKNVDALTLANKTKWRGDILAVYNNGNEFSVDVRTTSCEGSPKEAGELEIDTFGDEVKAKRRRDARTRIASGNNIVYALPSVMMGKTWTSRKPESARIPSEIKENPDFFPWGPTSAQEKALRAAFNSPDITIIQGPPGTGKTQVIAALSQWLAMNRYNIEKQTLLSSFQHEAVDNLALRCHVFDLPVIRFSDRHKVYDDVFQEWQQKMIDDIKGIRKEYQESSIFKVLTRVHEISSLYEVNKAGSPRISEVVKLLGEVIRIADDFVSASCISEGERLLDLCNRAISASAYPSSFYKAVYALRTMSQSYPDGGRDSIQDLLLYLERYAQDNLLEEKEIDTLKTIFSSDATPSEAELNNILMFRNKILDRCLNRTAATIQENFCFNSISEFFARVAAEMRKKCHDKINIQDEIFFSFYNHLQSNPTRFRYACKKYASVVASSTGQSSGQAMNELMKDKMFQNVIIDEAARANPMDLLIPMTRASRRIILVGDDKQLPHMLEQEIAQKVIAGDQDVPAAREERAKILEESLFQRIKKVVSDQEKKDAIVRFIMLDTQFRMRPALGQIISDSFYEGKLKNGKRNDQFPDVKPYGNISGIWRDVPCRLGTEFRDIRSRSLSREPEAKEVVLLAKKLLDDNPELSLGIITFYSAQVALINELLHENGIMRLSDKVWVPCETYVGRRIQVGTVDAFQGKEFDMVILSIVRSNQTPVSNDEKPWRKYGHLLFNGRVCVALSRQKSLLAVVGDKGMFEYNIESDSINAIKKFLEMCREGKNGIL